METTVDFNFFWDIKDDLVDDDIVFTTSKQYKASNLINNKVIGFKTTYDLDSLINIINNFSTKESRKDRQNTLENVVLRHLNSYNVNVRIIDYNVDKNGLFNGKIEVY